MIEFLELHNQDVLEENVEHFFQLFSEKFEEFNNECHHLWNEYPFIFSERAVGSAVFQAFLKIENTLLFMEQPFKLNETEQRFLDLYIDYNNRSELYLIELKHSLKAYRRNRHPLNEKTIEKWNDCVQQSHDLNSQTVANFCYLEKYPKIYRVSLMIMPIYLSQTNAFDENNLPEIPDNYLQNIQQWFSQNLIPEANRPNFIAVWNRGLSTNNENAGENESYIQYPFICIVAKIDTIRNNGQNLIL